MALRSTPDKPVAVQPIIVQAEAVRAPVPLAPITWWQRINAAFGAAAGARA